MPVSHVPSHDTPPPAPLSGWRRLVADMAAVGGATLVCQALGVATSLVLRGALNPAQMGVWQGLKLLLGYANYANLGVSKGAARELAIAAGSGERQRADQGLNLAFTINTLSSILYGCGLAAAALWLSHDRGTANPWVLGLIALGFLVVLQRHLTFHVTILRCRQQFTLTARCSMVEGLLTLALAGFGAWRWGLAGLYGGTFLAMAGTLAFLHGQGVRPFHFGWSWKEIKRLLAIGGSILMGGVALSVFQSLDKLMLLSFSPDREFDLGCYSTTLLITGQIYGLANMFAMVVAPRYAELFGRTGSPREAAGLAARASELLSAATSAAGVFGLLVVVPLLGHWFPDYRPGLAPALWLVPGVLFLALTLPLNQYLVAICRERISLVATVTALGAAAAADYTALRLGGGMRGVAAATAVVYAGYYLLTLGLSIWPTIDRAMRRRYLWTHAVLFAPVAMAVCLMDAAFEQGRFSHHAIASLAGLMVWAAAVMVVWWKGAWGAAWRGKSKVQSPKSKVSSRATLDFGLWTLGSFAARCQKPNHRIVGNWMARRIARPMALRITWLVAPTGVSAHVVTCLATVVALLAAVCFAAGSAVACLAGALLLQFWYLLDHVDGQIARLRGSASLDGVQFDYLMHHIVNLVLPCSLGYGLWKSTGQEFWLPLGFAYAVGLLLLGLANDTRSKAIADRIEELDGIPLVIRPQRRDRVELSVDSGALGKVGWDELASPTKSLLRSAVHLARKLCEIHVVMNVVTGLAVVQFVADAPWLLGWYVASMAPLAVLTAVATLARDIRRGAAEREFFQRYTVRIDAEGNLGTWDNKPCPAETTAPTKN